MRQDKSLSNNKYRNSSEVIRCWNGKQYKENEYIPANEKNKTKYSSGLPSYFVGGRAHFNCFIRILKFFSYKGWVYNTCSKNIIILKLQNEKQPSTSLF